MNGVTYYPEAIINGKPRKDVFKCHKDTRVPFSNMDMMSLRELQGNDIVAFTMIFGDYNSPLYKLMEDSKKELVINTEK